MGEVIYNLIKPWKTLDPWQQEVLQTEGDLVLRSGRQVGKSTIISIKAGEYAVQNEKKEIMIIASVERQAHHLFRKVISYLNENHKGAIKGRPTLTFVELKNGSIIRCLPERHGNRAIVSASRWCFSSDINRIC